MAFDVALILYPDKHKGGTGKVTGTALVPFIAAWKTCIKYISFFYLISVLSFLDFNPHYRINFRVLN